MSDLSCWICGDEVSCICAGCQELEQTSRQLEKEWDEQEALTQSQIEEEQLELKL